MKRSKLLAIHPSGSPQLRGGLLLTHTIENSRFFHGNLGLDLLQQAEKTTFDLKAATLALHQPFYELTHYQKTGRTNPWFPHRALRF